jgi:hypothetical protein
MPIFFEKGWNGLHLSKLKLSPVAAGENPANAVGNIARFWMAKARMNKRGPLKVADLDTKIAALAEREETAKLDPTQRFTSKMKADKEAFGKERTTIQAALNRGKVTSSMVKKFAPELIPGLTKGDAKLLDPVMEQIHNDRLRIPDAGMLKEYSSLSIERAIAGAKPVFTQDAKVAGLFERALARDGEPVKITQGVHQAENPHFDVQLPGETQQIHVEVTLGKPLVIRSVSYMLGPKKDSGSRTVLPDGQAAPIVVI